VQSSWLCLKTEWERLWSNTLCITTFYDTNIRSVDRITCFQSNLMHGASIHDMSTDLSSIHHFVVESIYFRAQLMTPGAVVKVSLCSYKHSSNMPWDFHWLLCNIPFRQCTDDPCDLWSLPLLMLLMSWTILNYRLCCVWHTWSHLANAFVSFPICTDCHNLGKTTRYACDNIRQIGTIRFGLSLLTNHIRFYLAL